MNDADSPKYFFQEKYAPLNVRGNFLTLCACPKNVELGEWLAHQSKQICKTQDTLHAQIRRMFIRTNNSNNQNAQSSNSIVCSMACFRSYRR